jgi:hypothetical protein
MPQICCTVPKELIDAVTDLAEKDNRSFSQMASMLLTNAVKEKIRLREKNKKQQKGENGN